MRWEGERESSNVEDARGSGGGFGGIGVGGVGLGTVAVALVAGMLFGVNPLTILGMLSGDGGSVQQAPAPAPPANDREARFVSTVLADTEDVWNAQFQRMGAQYQAPKLRLFSHSQPTACGRGVAAMGPFYCPADMKVYIDLSFYNDLKTRLGAPGDFAQAYVIAHEVGHHVQRLLGTAERAEAQRTRNPAAANEISQRIELQADCYAGIWAHDTQRAKNWIEQGDIEEGLNAASAVGDDKLQHRTRGEVVPESFTHGTSAQRVAWFKRGLNSGDIRDCNTFNVARL